VGTYVLEWFGLLLRWAHAAAAIAWIGAAFYFFWRDRHPDSAAGAQAGGEAWIKWEAYGTWITGFFLLCVIYYARAELYLIEPSVLPMSKATAIGLGLGTLVVGLALYEGLCRSPLVANDAALVTALVVLLAAAAWGLCQVFGGRGAFIHYGALLGTLMVGNVAHVILPCQRRMAAALAAGRAPDAKDLAQARLRSAHNTYLALPTLFTMLSSHYAVAFEVRWNWLALVAMTAAGVLLRAAWVARHEGRSGVWPLLLGTGLALAPALFLAPNAGRSGQADPGFAAVKAVIDAHCAVCHSAHPAFPGIAVAPKALLLDSPARIRAAAAQIRQQMVLSRAMPPGNVTAITEEQRALVERWILAGAPTD
jgi:uncharacterized membrane protein